MVQEIDPLSMDVIPRERRVVVDGNPFNARSLADLMATGNWRNPLRTQPTLVIGPDLGREIWRLAGRSPDSLPPHPGPNGMTSRRRAGLIEHGWTPLPGTATSLSRSSSSSGSSSGSRSNADSNADSYSSNMNDNAEWAAASNALLRRQRTETAATASLPARLRPRLRSDMMLRHMRERTELRDMHARLRRERRRSAADAAEAAARPRSFVDRLGLRGLWPRR